jgi:S-formylglutathione hydrolase FrmB
MRSYRRLGLGLGLLLLLVSVGSLAQDTEQPLRFHIKLGRTVASQAVSGRLLVFMAPFEPPRDELSPDFGANAHRTWVAASEIHNLKPEGAVDLDPDQLAYPAPFSTRKAGDYQFMALLDMNHDYAYAGDTAGDLRSPVLSLQQLDPKRAGALELTLSVRVPERKLELLAGTDLLDFQSPALTAFWGRPISMRGVVVLPPSYATTDKKFTTVYWTHGYGGTLPALAKYIAPSYQRMMQEGKLPEMVYVLLDESCPGGTHEFADSVNNGPWGKAFTQELIPYLESKYRMEGGRNGRLLTGHSSGGWAALWLEVTYPEIFGGSWPTSPDPSDFRSFTGPNLRARPAGNFYRGPDGKPWMLVREKGKDTMSLDDYAHQERVLGDYGGQFASFEWVFSPRGRDGRPMPMFDRDTGAINPEVADAWVKYDIAEVLRKNADRLRPLLENRIHLIVGTEDTFHLDEPARLLEETAKELGIKIQFTYLEGKNHMNLYEGGLEEQIGQEMETLVHPKAKAAAQ